MKIEKFELVIPAGIHTKTSYIIIFDLNYIFSFIKKKKPELTENTYECTQD